MENVRDSSCVCSVDFQSGSVSSILPSRQDIIVYCKFIIETLQYRWCTTQGGQYASDSFLDPQTLRQRVAIKPLPLLSLVMVRVLLPSLKNHLDMSGKSTRQVNFIATDDAVKTRRVNGWIKRPEKQMLNGFKYTNADPFHPFNLFSL